MQESAEYPSPSFRLIAVIALCIGVGAGAWAFFSFIIPGMSDDGKTVLIQADKSPIKTPPDQPGGMEIPHQDKLVFNAVTPGAPQPVQEHLAPPPEQPLFAMQPAPQPPVGQTDAPGQMSAPAPQAAAAPAQPAAPIPVALGRAIAPGTQGTPSTPIAATQSVKVAEPPASFDFDKGAAPAPQPVAAKAKPAVMAEKAKPAETAVAQNDAGAADTGSDEETATDAQPSASSPRAANDEKTIPMDSEEQPAAAANDDIQQEELAPPTSRQAKPVVTEKEEAPAPVAKASSAGRARYQLASYTDRASAQKAIGTFSSKYSGVISKSSLTVVSGQAKGRQVFRVQGSAGSKDEASAICGRVKAKGGACVLTGP